MEVYFSIWFHQQRRFCRGVKGCRRLLNKHLSFSQTCFICFGLGVNYFLLKRFLPNSWLCWLLSVFAGALQQLPGKRLTNMIIAAGKCSSPLSVRALLWTRPRTASPASRSSLLPFFNFQASRGVRRAAVTNKPPLLSLASASSVSGFFCSWERKMHR